MHLADGRPVNAVVGYWNLLRKLPIWFPDKWIGTGSADGHDTTFIVPVPRAYVVAGHLCPAPSTFKTRRGNILNPNKRIRATL